MKKGLMKFLTLITAGVMSVSLFAGCNTTPPPESEAKKDLSGYVALDINPSVELVTDKDGIVTEVRAVNKDAKILLSDMELIGLKVDVAVEKITQDAEATGYISTSNTDVSITIGVNSAEAEAALKALVEEGVKKGSEIVIIKADEIKVAIEQAVADFKAQNATVYANLTEAKLKIINSIMEYDRNFTVEMGANMSIEQLIDILEDYMEDYGEMYSDELEDMFEAKMDELMATIEAKIDEVFGAGYAFVNEVLSELEALEAKFETQLEAAQENVNHFNFDRDLDDDADDFNVTLTADMKTELNEVLNKFSGELAVDFMGTINVNVAVEINDLDQLDDFIDELEEAMEDFVDAVTLTPEQIAQIEQYKAELKANMAQFKQAAMDALQPLMEQIRLAQVRAKELKIQMHAMLNGNK